MAKVQEVNACPLLKVMLKH